MKKIITRFGEVEYDPEKTIYFPEGLIGFEDLRDFIVMPNRKEGPLFWIQSVDDPQVAFVLTDPTNFFLEYKALPDSQECQKLGIKKSDACYTLAVVTVPPNRKITLNLAAPILFSPKTNRAIQVAIEGNRYKVDTSLP